MENENKFKISRTFNVPRELMFDVWTNPKHLEKWWGPPDMTVDIKKMELKTGGTFLYFMKTPDGGGMHGKFIYREIISPEKLVFVVSFCDENENKISHPMAPTWPLEILSTILFREENGRTTIEMTGEAINASNEEVKTFVEGFGSMNEGWNGTLQQLENYLSQLIS